MKNLSPGYRLRTNLIFIVIIAIHILLIKNYPISVEFAFINFAKYFENYDNNLLLEYIDIQANTIYFSYLIFIFKNFFFIDDYLHSGRLLVLFSYLFIYLGIKNIDSFFKIKDSKLFNLVILLIIFNPILWIYSFKTTSDLLPCTIGFYALSVLIRSKSYKTLIFSAFLLSNCILLKPMFGILYIFAVFWIFLIHSNLNYIERFLRIFFYTILSFVPFFIYLIIFKSLNIDFNSYDNINIYLLNLKNFNIINYSYSFLYQLGILAIFTFPVIIEFFFLKKNRTKIYFILLISFTVGFNSNYFPGELDLGSLFNIQKNVLQGIYFICAILFIYSNVEFYNQIDKKNKNFYIILLVTTFIYILILSLFRPAQRYLMVLIPFYYYFYLALKKDINYKLKYMIIFLFVILNLILTEYTTIKSDLAKKTLVYLTKNNIINNTIPGPVSDSYNFKKLNHFKKKYIITKKKPEKFIKNFESRKFLLTINYYLIENK